MPHREFGIEKLGSSSLFMVLFRVAVDGEPVTADAHLGRALSVVEAGRGIELNPHLGVVDHGQYSGTVAGLPDGRDHTADQGQDVLAGGLVLLDHVAAGGLPVGLGHEDILVELAAGEFSLAALVGLREIGPVGLEGCVAPLAAGLADAVLAAGLAGLESPLGDEAGQDVDGVVDLGGVVALVCDGSALRHPLVVDVHASHVLVEDKAGGAHTDGERDRVKHSDRECLNCCYAVVVGLTSGLFVSPMNSFSEITESEFLRAWIHGVNVKIGFG